MRYHLKNFFSAFTKFGQECLNLPFPVKIQLVTSLIAVVSVCGVVCWLIICLGRVVKTMESIDNNLVMVTQNLIETQVEVIKLQSQLTELTDHQDTVNADLIKQSGVFNWKNAILFTGISIVVGVIFVGAYAYINHDILQDLSQTLSAKDITNPFWDAIDKADSNTNRFDEYDRGY